MNNWHQFSVPVQLDFKLWLCFMAFFLVFRIVFILTFKAIWKKRAPFPPCWQETLVNGARYDGVVATLWILIPFGFSILSGFINSAAWATEARMITGIVFMVISSIICVITISYFREFDDQFNHFIFNLIYDDLKASILTIIKAYHVIEHAIGITAAAILGWYLTKVFISSPILSQALTEQLFSSLPSQIGATFVIIYLLIIGARGTLGLGPPLRERHAAITKDKFLNKTVMNPYKALAYAIAHQLNFFGTDGIKIFLPDKGIARAAQFVFSNEELHDDLDRYMRTQAKGPKGTPPRHIFYIVAESYSAWPLWDKYSSLHLTDGLKGLAREGFMIRPLHLGFSGNHGHLEHHCHKPP